MDFLYSSALSFLSEDGKLLLEKNYEFCGTTGTEEYKQDYFENFLKNVDANSTDYQKILSEIEVSYNLHRHGCEKFSEYHELRPTKIDHFIINNKEISIVIMYF